MLGDHPPHGCAQQMGSIDCQVVQQAIGDVGICTGYIAPKRNNILAAPTMEMVFITRIACNRRSRAISQDISQKTCQKYGITAQLSLQIRQGVQSLSR